jgi:hypothetical protein
MCFVPVCHPTADAISGGGIRKSRRKPLREQNKFGMRRSTESVEPFGRLLRVQAEAHRARSSRIESETAGVRVISVDVGDGPRDGAVNAGSYPKLCDVLRAHRTAHLHCGTLDSCVEHPGFRRIGEVEICEIHHS